MFWLFKADRFWDAHFEWVPLWFLAYQWSFTLLMRLISAIVFWGRGCILRELLTSFGVIFGRCTELWRDHFGPNLLKPVLYQYLWIPNANAISKWEVVDHHKRIVNLISISKINGHTHIAKTNRQPHFYSKINGYTHNQNELSTSVLCEDQWSYTYSQNHTYTTCWLTLKILELLWTRDSMSWAVGGPNTSVSQFINCSSIFQGVELLQ